MAIKTKYVVKKDFQYTDKKRYEQGDEFIPEGYKNDKMIINAPNLITKVDVEVEDKPKPKRRRRKKTGSKS